MKTYSSRAPVVLSLGSMGILFQKKSGELRLVAHIRNFSTWQSEVGCSSFISLVINILIKELRGIDLKFQGLVHHKEVKLKAANHVASNDQRE